MEKEIDKIKHHFVQQKFLKEVFKKDTYDIFNLDLYRNKKQNYVFNDFVNKNKNTREIFNSNFLLDNQSDSYWSDIEKNGFLINHFNQILCPNTFISTLNLMNPQERKNMFDYFFMLIIRSPVEYWDNCQKQLINNNSIEAENLKKKINQELIDKHRYLVNHFLSFNGTISNDRSIVNLSYRIIGFTKDINFIGESIGIYFEIMNPNTKLKIYNAFADGLISNPPNIIKNLNREQIFNIIEKVFSLAFLIPHKKGFIYFKNNYSNEQIDNNILKIILEEYYHGLYFQQLLMSSLNQLVIIDDNIACSTFNIYEKMGQIEYYINKNSPLYEVYASKARILKNTHY